MEEKRTKDNLGLNRNMLQTYIVKSQISSYLQNGYSYEKIMKRIWEIHKIHITEKELKDFIKTNRIKEYLK